MNSDLPVTIYSCIFGSSIVVVFLPKSGIYTTLKVVCTTLVVFGAVNSFHQGRHTGKCPTLLRGGVSTVYPVDRGRPGQTVDRRVDCLPP